MTIAAVVFDFDGVILESADIKTRAFAALFADRPEHVAAVVALHLANEGVSRHRKFEMIYRDILGEDLDERRRQDLSARFETLVRDAVATAPFVVGAEAALCAMSARLPLFVASGTPQQELDGIVAQRALGRHFVEVVGSPPAKAEQLSGILERHRLEPSCVLMVGDALTDLDAARANRTHFLGIGQTQPWGKFPTEVTTRPNLLDLADYVGHLV